MNAKKIVMFIGYTVIIQIQMIESEQFFARYLSSSNKPKQVCSESRLMQLNANSIRLSPPKYSFLRESINKDPNSIPHLQYLHGLFKSLVKSSNEVVEMVVERWGLESTIDCNAQFVIRRLRMEQEKTSEFFNSVSTFDKFTSSMDYKAKVEEQGRQIEELSEKCSERKACLKKLHDLLEEKEQMIQELSQSQVDWHLYQSIIEALSSTAKYSSLLHAVHNEQAQGQLEGQLQVELAQDLELAVRCEQQVQQNDEIKQALSEILNMGHDTPWNHLFNELTSLINQQQSYQAQIDALSSQLQAHHDLTAQLAKAHTSFSKLQAQHDKTGSLLHEAQQKNDHLQNVVAEQDDRLYSLQHDLAKSAAALDKLRNQHASLEDQLAIKEKIIVAQEKDLKNTKEIIHKLETNLKSKSDNIKLLNSEKDSLVLSLKSLQRQLKDAQEDFQDQIQAKEHYSRQLQQSSQDYQNRSQVQIDQQIQEMETLKHRLNEMVQENQTQNIKIHELYQVQEQYNDASQSNINLEQQNRDLEQEKNVLEQEKLQLERQNRMIRGELESLQEESTQNKMSIAQMEKSKLELQQKVAEKEEELYNQLNTIYKLEEEKERALNESQRENSEAISRIKQDLEREVEVSQRKNKTLKELSAQQEKMSEKASLLEQEISQLKKALKEQQDESVCQVQFKDKEVSRFRKQVEYLEQENESLLSANRKQKGEFNELRDHFASKQSENEEMKQKFQMELKELELRMHTSFSQMEKEKVELKSELELKDQLIKKHENDHEKILLEKSSMENKLSEMENDYHEMSIRLKENEMSIIKETQEKNEVITQQMRDYQAEIGQYKKILKEKESQFAINLSQYQNKNSDLSSRLSDLNKRLKQKTEEHHKLKLEMEDWSIKEQIGKLKEDSIKKILQRAIRYFERKFQGDGQGQSIEYLLDEMMKQMQKHFKDREKENKNGEVPFSLDEISNIY